MALTALERILTTERLRQRAAKQGGFSVPALLERKADSFDGPFFASTMRGSFLPTRISKEGFVRFGCAPLPVGGEAGLLRVLCSTLRATSQQEGWANRCTSIEMAVSCMHSFGYEPHHVVVGPSLLSVVAPDVSLVEAQNRMQAGSKVALFDGIPILLADLPEGQALITSHPNLLGVYTRVGDYVGVLLQHADKAVVVVA